MIMLNQEKFFRFSFKTRLLIYLSTPFWFLMGISSYFVFGEERVGYLWLFGVLTGVYLFYSWYYYRFKLQITDQGIRRIPSLKSFWVRWEDVAEAQLFDTDHIILKLKSNKQKEMLLKQYENQAELIELLQKYIPGEKFRKALPYTLTSFNRRAPFIIIGAVCGLVVGIRAGYYSAVWLGLFGGIIASVWFVFIWRQEIRQGTAHKHFGGNGLFFMFLFTLLVAQHFIKSSNLLDVLLVTVVVLAGEFIVIMPAALITNKIFGSSDQSKAESDREGAVR